MFTLKKDRFKGKKRIGKGQFGEVFPYQKTEEDFQWVVKRMEVEKEEFRNLQGQMDYDRTYQKLINDIFKCFPEIVIGFSCDHPCIVPVKGYFIEKTENGYDFYMKLPRMKMSLADEFKSREFIDAFYEEAQLVKYFYSLASGVDYLHKRKIFHRDIKINNILLDDQGNARISDVGTAKHVADEDSYHLLTGDHGAINYKAPELIQYENQIRKLGKNPDYNLLNNPLQKDSLEKIDSWSLGLAMLELCALKLRLVSPYKPLQDIQEDLDDVRKNIETRKLYRGSLLDLIFGLLRVNPEERLKISDVKMRLEAEFQEIITEEHKACMGLLKEDSDRKSQVCDDHFQKFKDELKETSQKFEDEMKGKLDGIEDKIKNLEEKLLSGFKSEIERMSTRKNREMEEMNKRCEEIIESLKRENVKILKEREELIQKMKNLEENLEGLQRQGLKEKSGVGLNLKSEEGLKIYRERLDQVIMGFEKRWKDRFDIKRNKDDWLTVYKKNDKITDQDLENWVIDLIKNCKEAEVETDLMKLWVDVNWCHQITDAGVKSLGDNIASSLKNLNHLTLYFGHCRQITDTGVKSLSDNIASSLKNLNHLTLYFGQCEQITDTGVKSLSDNIASSLKNLNHLTLYFGQTEVSENLKQTLRAEFKKTIGEVDIR